MSPNLKLHLSYIILGFSIAFISRITVKFFGESGVTIFMAIYLLLWSFFIIKGMIRKERLKRNNSLDLIKSKLPKDSLEIFMLAISIAIGIGLGSLVFQGLLYIFN